MGETIAWGRWDCTRCGQKDISGRDKRCSACGDPREQAELDAMRPPTAADFAAAAITEAPDRELAQSGADWSCGFCGTNNRGTDGVCASCGGSREHAASMGQVGVVGAETAADLPVQETGGTGHPEGRPRRHVGRLSLGRVKGMWGALSRTRKILIVVGVFLVGLIAYTWWGNSTRERDGAVTRLTWRHVTEVQAWSDVVRGRWGRPTPASQVRPVGGTGGQPGIALSRCYQKHHHDEQYACGTETYQDTESYSCGSRQECSTVNNGNGSFSQSCRTVSESCTRSVTKTRTKYCSRPIFQEWCDYLTQDWVAARTAAAEGEGHETRWVSLVAQGDLERVVQIGTYTVYAAAGDEAHSIEVPRAEYDAYEVGTPMILSVRNFGGVEAMRRAD